MLALLLAPVAHPLAAASAARSAAGEIPTVDLGGLEARSAALLLSGQEAGDLGASFLAVPLAGPDGGQRLLHAQRASHRPHLVHAVVTLDLLEEDRPGQLQGLVEHGGDLRPVLGVCVGARCRGTVAGSEPELSHEPLGQGVGQCRLLAQREEQHRQADEEPTDPRPTIRPRSSSTT